MDARPVTIRRAAYRDATRVFRWPGHRHTDLQMYCVVAGQVAIDLRDRPNALLRQEYVSLIEPQVERSVSVRSEKASYIWVVFSNHTLVLDGLHNKSLRVPPALRPDFHELSRQLRDATDVNNLELVDALVVRLLIGLRMHHAGNVAAYSSPVGRTTEAVVSRVIGYMQRHLELPLTRDELAKIAGVSAPHLARLFRKQLGKTPQQVLTSLRMERAQALLLDESLPLTRVPEQLGLSSYSHFTSLFRREVGMDPATFRARGGLY